ncbi:MAG: hypothetical protein MR481_01325 [Campylobacter sp.]|nr:hypothetical protein [Campylobacter sp.]
MNDIAPSALLPRNNAGNSRFICDEIPQRGWGMTQGKLGDDSCLEFLRNSRIPSPLNSTHRP